MRITKEDHGQGRERETLDPYRVGTEVAWGVSILLALASLAMILFGDWSS